MPNRNPKNVVYLIGAGATQAEVSFLGAPLINMLMGDNARLGGDGVSTRILKRLPGKWKRFLGSSAGIDTEKIISLLDASGNPDLVALAQDIRILYFEEIRRSIPATIFGAPLLATSLFEMHANERFKDGSEALTAVLSTNHDGLLQVASQAAFGGVNLGFEFSSSRFKSVDSTIAPPILQLHGSFTWRLAIPVRVTKLHSKLSYQEDTIWIPPTILKESKSYPFNKLMALAYEALASRCDVLRVIGASLTQNDWNILSLIFNAQRLQELERSRAFQVELIMPHGVGESVVSQCSFLKNLFPIGFLSQGRFAEYKNEGLISADSDLMNPFAYWLQQKILFHQSNDEFGLAQLSGVMAKVAGEDA